MSVYSLTLWEGIERTQIAELLVDLAKVLQYRFLRTIQNLDSVDYTAKISVIRTMLQGFLQTDPPVTDDNYLDRRDRLLARRQTIKELPRYTANFLPQLDAQLGALVAQAA